MSEKKDWKLPPFLTGGPVVKNGPNGGKNRARNNNGRWRAKRNDTAKSRGGKSKCFLTTAACEYRGLPDDCRELQVLRNFRDKYLLVSAEGRLLVEEYYSNAPAIVEQLYEPADFETIWKAVTECIWLIESNQPEKAVDTYRVLFQHLRSRLRNQCE